LLCWRPSEELGDRRSVPVLEGELCLNLVGVAKLKSWKVYGKSATYSGKSATYSGKSATYSGRAKKVAGFTPEWVADFLRNTWPVSFGMGGRFRPQSAPINYLCS
jgi:hypothetical protein